MADVFISYARAERAEAEAVKQRLEALGLSVFLDVEGLDGGDIFSEVLDREVKTSKIVLGLWSPAALSRPWVQIECDIGKRRGVLIPVAIKPFRDMDVPAPFWNIQFVDLTDALHDANDPNWAKLNRSLARTLNRPDLIPRKPAVPVVVREPAPARPAPRAAAKAQPTGSPWPGIIVAGVLLLAVGGGAFWYFDPMGLGLRAPESQIAAAPDPSAAKPRPPSTGSPPATAAATPPTPMTAAAAPASAQPDACALWKSKWASAGAGTDVAAMDSVIAQIPGTCPALRTEAATRRTAAAKEAADAKIAATRRAEQQKAPEPQRQVEVAATPPPVDPCEEASNDWRSVQNGSEAALTSYIAGLSATCGNYRALAQDKLDKLVAARLVAERQQLTAAQAAEQRRLAAAQFDAVTTAAKATGIEGKWKDPINVTGSRKAFLETRCYLGQQIVITNGQLSMGGYLNPIRNVSGKTITIDGVTFTVDGDNMKKRFLSSGEEFVFWRCP